MSERWVEAGDIVECPEGKLLVLDVFGDRVRVFIPPMTPEEEVDIREEIIELEKQLSIRINGLVSGE